MEKVSPHRRNPVPKTQNNRLSPLNQGFSGTGVFEIKFESFLKSVPTILNKAGLGKLIKDQKRILLKPNLTTNYPPPCTTPVELVEEVVKFCQKNSKAEILIVEGSGGCETALAFRELGYEDLLAKYQVKLIDLNREKRIKYSNPNALLMKEVKLPEILFDGFFINLPVLKQHNEGIMTCAAKNLFGIYLNSNLITQFTNKWWNKSELHFKYTVQKSVYDLNLYRPSDFVLVDASIGQIGNEITGNPCSPPIKKLIAGFDNFEVDRYVTPYLNLDPIAIPYLNYGAN